MPHPSHLIVNAFSNAYLCENKTDFHVNDVSFEVHLSPLILFKKITPSTVSRKTSDMLMTGTAMTALSIEVLGDAGSWVDWVVVRVEV